jgi:hypothetical protein
MSVAIAMGVLALPAVSLAATFTVTSSGSGDTAAVSRLISVVDTANTAGGSNTIMLSGTFDLTAPADFWYGPEGLPAISSTLTIEGDPTAGATIERSGSTPFRLLYVSGGASGPPAGNLTLEDLTLTGGEAQGGSSENGGGGAGMGGAIFNQGTLLLEGVTVNGNTATGGSSGMGAADSAVASQNCCK